MVLAMAKDRGLSPRVAWVTSIAVGIVACAPTVKPPSPPAEPGPVAKLERPHGPPPGRQVVVGELCPQAAAGRPAVDPLIMRALQWTDTASEVDAAVERGSVPRFIVFGTDGKLAGVFDTLGVAEVAGGQTVASGTYTGASPCTHDSAAKPTSGATTTRADDPACTAATHGCGLAVGELSSAGEPPETPALPTGGACMNGSDLAVDIDGDGRIESFPIGDVLDGIRAPAKEWTASPTATASCTPQFSLYDLKLMAPPDPGKHVDPKSLVMADLLGVVDLDGDGRKELVLALRFPTVRSIVVYTARESAQRLELAGEAQTLSR
jgi:hypothetical protein